MSDQPEVRELTHDDLHALIEEQRKASKDLRELPRLVGSAVALVWRAGRRPFVISIVLQVLTGVSAGLQILLGKDVLASILRANAEGGGIRPVLPTLLTLGAITAAMRLFTTYQNKQSRTLTLLTGRRATEGLLDVSTRVPLDYFDDPDFYNRLQRAELQAALGPYQMVIGLLGLGTGLLSMIGIAVALIAIEPLFFPLILAGYLPVSFVNKRVRRERYSQALALTESERERGYLEQVMRGRDEAKELRAFGLAPVLRRRYARLSDEVVALNIGQIGRHTRMTVAANLAQIAVGALVLGILAWFVATQRLSPAVAGTALAAVQMLSNRLESTLGSTDSLFQTAMFLRDYVDFMAIAPAVDAARPAAVAPASFDELKVEGVSFRYRGATQFALQDVGLEIRRGEIIALVGENGSGKTTLAKLLANLYRPTTGRITWDGTDTATVDPDQLRDAIALIFQDFIRYKLPARENIGMGRAEHVEDLERVRRAATQAGADAFLDRLPKGYETVLSKEFAEGRDLSLGQWQRVALARAFFRDAPFIILDEPTAALDPRAERALFDSIRGLTIGRTVLLISHRFSSVRNADRIYVMAEGRVAERGTHAELMAAGGLYAELFTLQAEQYLDSV